MEKYPSHFSYAKFHSKYFGLTWVKDENFRRIIDVCAVFQCLGCD